MKKASSVYLLDFFFFQDPAVDGCVQSVRPACALSKVLSYLVTHSGVKFNRWYMNIDVQNYLLFFTISSVLLVLSCCYFCILSSVYYFEFPPHLSANHFCVFFKLTNHVFWKHLAHIQFLCLCVCIQYLVKTGI